MKQVMLAISLLGVVYLSTGCSTFTKGVETLRGTVVGAIDTGRNAVDTVFSVVGKGAETAEKIADASLGGAKETVAPVVTDPVTPQ
jgi:hypothetical protein